MQVVQMYEKKVCFKNCFINDRLHFYSKFSISTEMSYRMIQPPFSVQAPQITSVTLALSVFYFFENQKDDIRDRLLNSYNIWTLKLTVSI